MAPLLRSAVTGLVPRHCYRGHFFVTRAGRFLGTEIVPPDERLVIAAPERTVIQSLHASERNCKHRAFIVALLVVRIGWYKRTGIVDVVDPAHAGKIFTGFKSCLRGHRVSE